MIHAENLTKYYRDFCAVDQISFDIRPGEVLGLLGPNGAGKTTTLRMLTGFLKPTDGTVKIKNVSIDENPLEIKKLMGYLPESAPLYHEMLVYDYLNFVADIRQINSGKKETRIRELANLCGLNKVMHKPIAVLSKGYKQRVGLAHAILGDPEILILDEPTSGLDPNQIVEIREIIRRIGREKTVILSTHILSEAEATCDRIMIIHQGRIVADGDAADLRRAADEKHRIRVGLTGATFDTIKKSFEKVEGVETIDLINENDMQVTLDLVSSGKLDIRGELYRRIKATDWILYEFSQQVESLETIFRELTKEN
ncbi:MAG: ABC transporter ATP-binding protein [Deltaproteobacteria bacterium]|nr:MAG: ABC transporter ATP-binding protein [Deltaproteobacteria bacterium]